MKVHKRKSGTAWLEVEGREIRRVDYSMVVYNNGGVLEGDGTLKADTAYLLAAYDAKSAVLRTGGGAAVQIVIEQLVGVTEAEFRTVGPVAE